MTQTITTSITDGTMTEEQRLESLKLLDAPVTAEATAKVEAPM